MKILKEKNKYFSKNLKSFLDNRNNENLESIDHIVNKIIKEVQVNGDKALIKYTKKFDKTLLNKSEILLTKKKIKENNKNIDNEIIKSYKIAISNITKFHKKQLPQNYQIKNNDSKIGLLWKPIESVGLYVPGGNASYPSSLLMNVIPAKVAGVKRIVVVTPTKNGFINPYVTALIEILNIKEVYQIGGAQAIAALAYGTNTIKSVNKIFGPGNSYVASAKKKVFGKVGIDLIAGPSEIVVVADKNNNSDWVAADILAQAEHDDRAQAILITDNEKFANDVKKNIIKLTKSLLRKKIIQKSINNCSAIIVLDNLDNASEIINTIAPEHLHLQNKNFQSLFNKIRNAGCIFLGEYSAESFGDYIIGTNHVLPTSGSAKFSSGLGVLDFMKRSSFIKIGKKSFKSLGPHVIKLAEIENLEAHKLSVKIRQKHKK